MYAFQMGLLRILFRGGDDEGPPPWKEDREPEEVSVYYEEHDLDGKGWWVKGRGTRQKYDTKEQAIQAARKVVDEEEYLNIGHTFWEIHPPGRWDCWWVEQDPNTQADTKEEVVSEVLALAEENDTIIFIEEGEAGDKTRHKLSVEEARELVGKS